MSGLKTFFRCCPACGKRFHIKLVNEKLVDGPREETTRSSEASYDIQTDTFSEVIKQVTTEARDFEYSYRCGSCGHVWTEMRHRENEVR